MHRMPQSPEQCHGGAVRAAVGGSIAPGGKDHPFCMQNPLGRGEKKSTLVPAHAGHLGITAGLYPLIVAGKAQSVQYRCGSVAHRVHAPLRIRPAADPKPAEKGFRIGLGKDLRCLGQGAVIVVQLPVDVAEIASAVSGEQQLFPHPGQPLQQGDLCPCPGSRVCGGHAGCAAADDGDLCMCLGHGSLRNGQCLRLPKAIFSIAQPGWEVNSRALTFGWICGMLSLVKRTA